MDNEIPAPKTKSYLGDSVYIDKWQGGVSLCTNNGLQDENKIFLEPFVILQFLRYLVERGVVREGIINL